MLTAGPSPSETPLVGKPHRRHPAQPLAPASLPPGCHLGEAGAGRRHRRPQRASLRPPHPSPRHRPSSGHTAAPPGPLSGGSGRRRAAYSRQAPTEPRRGTESPLDARGHRGRGLGSEQKPPVPSVPQGPAGHSQATENRGLAQARAPPPGSPHSPQVCCEMTLPV